MSAYRLAVDEGLTPRIVADTLLALVSSLAEAGRMAEARQHADELLAVVAGLPAVRRRRSGATPPSHWPARRREDPVAGPSVTCGAAIVFPLTGRDQVTPPSG